MIIVRSQFWLVLVLLSGSAPGLASAGVVGEQVQCYEDWSVGAAIVKDRGLVSVEDLTKRAKSKLAGQIVKTTLCKTKDGYAYLVVVRTAEGRLKTVRIDAINPFSEPSKAQ